MKIPKDETKDEAEEGKGLVAGIKEELDAESEDTVRDVPADYKSEEDWLRDVKAELRSKGSARGAGTVSEAGSDEESVDEINFKEQLIGYIRDELKQGFTLKQVHDALIEQGYAPDEIDFVFAYIKTRFNVSDKSRSRKRRSDAHHLKTRFYLPVVGILLLTLGIMAILFTAQGAKEQQQQKLAELIPYYKLGLDPSSVSILSTKTLLDRVERVDTRIGKAFLLARRGSLLFDNLKIADDVVPGVQKTVRTYVLDDGASRTLVEIRAKVYADADNLKILEIIPKSILKNSSDLILKGGLVVEKDPAIQWSYSSVKEGQLIVIRYIVDKALEDFSSFTVPVIQKGLVHANPTSCGNSVCEVGESFRDCCVDCGCLPGFVCENNYCAAKPKDQCQIDAECDDSDPSTSDSCEGTPKKCVHTLITECHHGDDFCPEGCTYEDDLDCTPPEVFGNVSDQSVSTKEKFILNKSLPPWDPAFECHEDWWCTDGDSCTLDFCDQDTFKCYWKNITECVGGDYCCPPGCSSLDDSDC